MPIRIALLLILIAAILAFKFLPWYVLVGLAVLFMLSIRFLGRKLFEWLCTLPFRAKGAALRNASVEIHSIESCAAPESRAEDTGDGDDAETEEDEFDSSDGGPVPRPAELIVPRRYFRVVATITPTSAKQLFNHWEIGEVALGPPDYNPIHGDGDDRCPVEALEVELDGNFTPDDGYKLMGPQRLRFVVGVKPEVSRLVFNYYFERFGELSIPT